MLLHPVLKQVDFKRIVVMGHSWGGGATVTSAASAQPGVLAAAAIHPAPGGAFQLKVPTLYLCGEKDSTIPCGMIKPMYKLTATARSAFAELKNADHGEVMQPLPGGRWNFYLVQYALCYLESSEAACDYIYGTSADSLCSSGLMVECEVKTGMENATLV